ncbi:hypothetical protein QA600_18555 [Natronococcus sp. A-GB1]|uniref:hypothetical protein n=1 Tax=Natronococcus sp. A-GB1 TaxID=3037648 RepID=UPI00241F3CA4|nr:hypothetical protein [Natronococcus sp. A-GB1]MDG5761335.1 hypothetical protein [Natronococcus sp. A-GB1]
MGTVTGDTHKQVETYDLQLPTRTLEVEHVVRTDWDDLYDPCPVCQGTEFDHLRYEGGHYGHHQETVVQRSDYWDQQGSLYTACKSCDEVLYKSPAYDVLRYEEAGLLEDS